MDRVKPEPVDVELVHPIDWIRQKERPHMAIMLAVEVERVAPRRFVGMVEPVPAVSAQVIPVGAEMIVNNVEQNGEAARMRRIHQRAQILRMSITARGGVNHHPIVSPAAIPCEIPHRHDLDGRRAEIPHMV